MFNSQCSILIRKEKRPRVRAVLIEADGILSVEHLAIRHPLRMRIEHWELSIGQIPGRIHEKPCGTRWLPHLTLPRSAEVPTNGTALLIGFAWREQEGLS